MEYEVEVGGAGGGGFRVLTLIMGDLAAGVKAYVPQVVHTGVYGTHYSEDLSNLAKVIIYQTLIDEATT